MTSEGARKAWITRKKNARKSATKKADTRARKRGAARVNRPRPAPPPTSPFTFEMVMRELLEAKGHRERIYAELLRKIDLLQQKIWELWK